jgi:hypothetical protein
MSNTKLFLCFLFIIVLPLVSSCGKGVSRPETQIGIIEQTAREARLEKFDTQLAAIKDESTAKTAITTFADYVEGEPSGLGASASSVRILSVGLIDRLAKIEVTSRQRILGNAKATSVSSEEGLITIDKLTEAINAAKDPAAPEIKKDDVEFIQAGVRSELPHIVAGSSTNGESVQMLSTNDTTPTSTNVITPIEALVIGYAIATGDDGSAEPGTYKNNLPQEKVETFIDKITK